jgi:RimJ/RimL family protein N-acetyltransferase
MTLVPTLTTPRLILRAPRLEDFVHHADHGATGVGWSDGTPANRPAAWRVWASDAALWMLRGFGPFGVEDRLTGAYLGQVGIFQAEGYPGPELGWFTVPAARRQGIAREAAQAVLGWLRAHFEWSDIVSITDPDNTASQQLARALGARQDPARAGIDPGDVVFVHDLRGHA